MNEIRVTSFGYGHAPAPDADITLDTRRHLRNPHRDPTMREMTGLDARVRDHVLATPGARNLIGHATAMAFDLINDVAGQPVTVAVGCVGGRHRSVALAEEIATELRAEGLAVVIDHRDVDQPVIQR